jgi:hypothetical protein
MTTVRFRLIASEDDTQDLMNFLQSIEDIERVEEVADMMPHMDDDDSSSAGLSDDSGPGLHCVELEAPNDEIADRVRDVAQERAYRSGMTIEFVDRF